MRLIVAGSRTFNDKKRLFHVLDNIIPRFNITQIVSGTAKGADSLGEEYAFENNIECLRFPAEWNLYGKAAGHRRNRIMAENSDYALVFWDGSSRGTKNMIDTMIKMNKPVITEIYGNEDNFDGLGEFSEF